MTNAWSILGLRKTSDADENWRGYAKALRKTAGDEQRRRARDAFDALELGLWGRFTDGAEPENGSAGTVAEPEPYYGPLAGELVKLDQLLTSSADELVVREQIDALFDNPEIREASNYLPLQVALAELLERHLPKSEPFILPAVDRFKHLTEQARDHPAVARLLDRADELALIEALEKGQIGHGHGWRPLARPASKLKRWFWSHDNRRGHIAAIYAYAGWHDPRLRRRIDDCEWEWWTRELSRERTSFGALLAWLTAAALIAAAAYQYWAPPAIAAVLGAAVFAFLAADSLSARWLISRRAPRPFDGLGTLVFAAAALLLPAFTRLLPPDPPSAALVATLAVAIGWSLRLTTGLQSRYSSSTWLDAAGLPAFTILFFALWLPIPWERYAMLASYVWLLHSILPQQRRAIALALDRVAALPWGYLLAGAAALLGLAAVFAAHLDINRESTRVALLVTSYALLAISIYVRRPFPLAAAWIGSMLIAAYLVIYCTKGGEYHPGPHPGAGETLLSGQRGDVLDWKAFPANGEEILDRIEVNNPEAYARLMPLLRRAACARGRDCAAYPIDGALMAEVGTLLDSMSNEHLAEWTRLEARVREAQFRNKSGACSSAAPEFGPLDPPDIRGDHAALVLDIVASGPRPPVERPDVALPDLETFMQAQERARAEVAALEGGPIHPVLRQNCIKQLVRAHTILKFDTDVVARITRGGYPQDSDAPAEPNVRR